MYLHPCRSPARADQDVQEGEQEELFIVTPTYSRQEQEAELTRLGQTLLLAGNITWIVVEDRQEVSTRTKNILAKFSSLNIVLMAGGTLTSLILISQHLHLQPRCLLSSGISPGPSRGESPVETPGSPGSSTTPAGEFSTSLTTITVTTSDSSMRWILSHAE